MKIDIAELAAALQALGVPMSNKAVNAVYTNLVTPQSTYSDTNLIRNSWKFKKADGTTDPSAYSAVASFAMVEDSPDLTAWGNTYYPPHGIVNQAVVHAGGFAGVVGFGTPGSMAAAQGFLCTPSGTAAVAGEGTVGVGVGYRGSSVGYGTFLLTNGTLMLPMRTTEPPKMKIPILRFVQGGSYGTLWYGRSDIYGASIALNGICQPGDTFYIRNAYTQAGVAHVMKDVQYQISVVGATASAVYFRFLQVGGASLDCSGYANLDVIYYHPYIELDNRRGMLAFADGSGWNPGSGKGIYYYDGSTWVKL